MVNSKQKGGQFERELCKAFSLWVTAGTRTDVFWRSAMSGGRATVSRQRGIDVRQCGDMCAVAPEGNELCAKWFFEFKHVKALGLEAFLIDHRGLLETFWQTALKEAAHHKRDPMIVAKGNGRPILVITKPRHLRHWVQPIIETEVCDVSLFTDLMASPFEFIGRAVVAQ